ncbi:MAG: FG-GAP repeat protein [Thermoanaerobaculia bacterium]|nr:FG-GAP repeat protein [Thermoanaerobaculia bacterium]
MIATLDAIGANTRPASDLPTGTVFWRAFGRAGGSAGTVASATWQFTVGARSAPVDTSWGTTPDVNGDGYADVIVGAPNANGGAGRMHVYLGGARPLTTVPAMSLDGRATGDAFGTSVASAGDINGDGYADVVVGAPASYYGSSAKAGALVS